MTWIVQYYNDADGVMYEEHDDVKAARKAASKYRKEGYGIHVYENEVKE